MPEQNEIQIGSKTISEMATDWDVSWSTAKGWLLRLGIEKPKNGGNIYSPAEVKEIYEKLGYYAT